MKEIEESLYAEALQIWGLDAQKGMLVEEVGELLQSLNKLNRGDNIEKFIEELVDVSIMINQMLMVYDTPNKAICNMIKTEKLLRLAERLGWSSEEMIKLNMEIVKGRE